MDATKPVCVNLELICVNEEIANAANSASAKVIARKTGMSASRVYDLRSARFGVNAQHLIALAKIHAPLQAKIMALLTGEGTAHTPEAFNAIVRRLTK
jgi:hypothetical protein